MGRARKHIMYEKEQERYNEGEKLLNRKPEVQRERARLGSVDMEKGYAARYIQSRKISLTQSCGKS